MIADDSFEENSDSGDELQINEEGETSEKDENSECDKEKDPKKIFKRGIVYLSFIPPGMSPVLLRNLLSRHAPVGRIYLQVVKEKGQNHKKNKYKKDNFVEGWVEFLKKRHAKKIAELMNNTQIGGKKKNKFHDYLWNLKYLPRFKWIHLVERLNYEKAVFKQRMRNEISQAKKVANHFKETVEKEERLRKKKKNNRLNAIEQKEEPIKFQPRQFKQRETLDEIKAKKKVEQKREDFLKNLFS